MAQDRCNWVPSWTEGHSRSYGLREDQTQLYIDQPLPTGEICGLTLAIKGPEPSFESLVNESGSTRGVSLATFLKRLEASESVVVDKANNSIQMINKRYTLFGSEDQTEKAKVGMAAVGNLLDTIAHNLNPPSANQEPFHQQGSWTNRLDRNESGRLRGLIKKFLLETDEKAREIMGPFEQDVVTENQITAGISMFYFEEETRGVHN